MKTGLSAGCCLLCAVLAIGCESGNSEEANAHSQLPNKNVRGVSVIQGNKTIVFIGTGSDASKQFYEVEQGIQGPEGWFRFEMPTSIAPAANSTISQDLSKNTDVKITIRQQAVIPALGNSQLCWYTMDYGPNVVGVSGELEFAGPMTPTKIIGQKESLWAVHMKLSYKGPIVLDGKKYDNKEQIIVLGQPYEPIGGMK